MHLNFFASSYHCDYVDFDATDEGSVVVTLYGNYPPNDEMTPKEISAIINDPLFPKLFGLARHAAMIGTPLFRAFERVKRGEASEAVLRFKRSDMAVAA